MAVEFEWKTLPVVKITDKDKELASMILTGTPNDESTKATRGFLYYNIAIGDFVLLQHYEKFLKLLRAYIYKTWSNVDWDKEIEGKELSDLEWDPHLEAYYLLKDAERKIEKIAL